MSDLTQVTAVELNTAKEKDGGDNYWLVALEEGVGILPCEEPSAFTDNPDGTQRPLTHDQKDNLQDYYDLYDQLHQKYRDVLESFGFKPRW
tara:strand:- start:800 stop:1072 length:273 start_codon:yes stop_codon:yes gene_type:complete